MAILQTSDFVGEFLIVKDNLSKLQNYIDDYEEHFLVRLMGVELYELFKADLTSSTPQAPQATRFLTIFNKFLNQDYGYLLESKGIKKMLVAFIYYKFMVENTYRKSTAGVFKAEDENSSNKEYQGFNLVEAYNYGVRTARSIQSYMLEENATYPEFDGVCFDFTSGI